MTLQEWMSQNARPQHPQFDGQAFRALDGRDARQGYMQDFRSQMGDFRDQMHDWRDARHDFRQSVRGDQPMQGLPTGEVPQPIPGSSYGFNLGQVLSQFPNGFGQRNSQPGLNPGY
jgi:hypothetical protein